MANIPKIYVAAIVVQGDSSAAMLKCLINKYE